MPQKKINKTTLDSKTVPIELPKEQLRELERAGIMSLDKKGNPIKQTKTNEHQHPEHSLEQLMELQLAGILSIYPKRD